MSQSLGRATALGAVLAGCGAQAWAMLVSLTPVDAPNTPVAPVESVRASATTASDSLVGLAIGRPMFRVGRRPAPGRFDPAASRAADASAPVSTPKPALFVSGIVWGVEPAAVIEGIPGVEGSAVLRRGEAASGIRVVRIDRERVLLRGLDTTWSLPVRNPWQ